MMNMQQNMADSFSLGVIYRANL